MAVIWGFDLSEMSWSAFKSRNMFNKSWHLRRERFILYQLAMLTCLAAECTATFSLSKYEDQQDHIEALSAHTAHAHNNDIIAAEVLAIVFCVLVATVFGAEFFFVLFWPRRMYPRWYVRTKEGVAVGVAAGVLAAAVMSTIVISRHSAFITGVNSATAHEYEEIYFRPPLRYNAWATNIAYVVLLWLGFVFTAASTAILFVAAKYDERYGTEPRSDGAIEEKPMV